MVPYIVVEMVEDVLRWYEHLMCAHEDVWRWCGDGVEMCGDGVNMCGDDVHTAKYSTQD